MLTVRLAVLVHQVKEATAVRRQPVVPLFGEFVEDVLLRSLFSQSRQPSLQQLGVPLVVLVQHVVATREHTDGEGVAANPVERLFVSLTNKSNLQPAGQSAH